MLKKTIYGVLLLILVYFLYTIFFKKIDSPVKQMEKEMKAKNVVYRLKDEAVIYADEQIGTNNDEVIKFKGVTVDLLKKNMLISAKEAEVNTKTSDIIMKREVVGRTKDEKWALFTEQVEYKKEGDKIISNARTKVINNQDKRELEADKVETTVAFEEITGVGNVIYKDLPRELKSDKIKYNDVTKIAEAEGNVVYKDDKSNITANKGIYYIEKRQVDATGNVIYEGKDLRVTAGHVFYDEIKQSADADGNGTFNYKPKKSNGTFKSGNYNLKDEILTTSGYYTMNYDDYKMNGTGLVYLFKTGHATLNKNFSVTKQNFSVSGNSGIMNTINKDIFANKMIMRSIQGDIITSNTGEGSFKKKEFKFDGNVNGKIRGNVKDFLNNPTKLIESEAVNFRGSTSKIYFVSHNNNDMSITRSEIKGNVHMIYKDVNLDSQYNEIDTSKNLVLARDQVIIDFKNDTQMTSNFLYLNLNTEIGTAQNNVKIVSKLPQFSNINTSADKAVVNIKDKKVNLTGNVVTYQGKTRVSSNSAIYDINRKVLENSGNIKMQYQLQDSNSNQVKSDPKAVAAINEVLNKLNISQSEVNTKGKIELIKNSKASNGISVTIKWETSNSRLLPISGKINKQFYGGGSSNVQLKAIGQSGNDSEEKTFNINIPTETIEEMLERASKNISIVDGYPSSVKVNVSKGMLDIPITWNGNIANLKYNNIEYKKQF